MLLAPLVLGERIRGRDDPKRTAPAMSDREGLIAELEDLEGEVEVERRRWLADHPDVLEPGFVEELCGRVYALLRVDLDRAGRLARATQLAADGIDDEP